MDLASPLTSKKACSLGIALKEGISTDTAGHSLRHLPVLRVFRPRCDALPVLQVEASTFTSSFKVFIFDALSTRSCRRSCCNSIRSGGVAARRGVGRQRL